MHSCVREGHAYEARSQVWVQQSLAAAAAALDHDPSRNSKTAVLFEPDDRPAKAQACRKQHAMALVRAETVRVLMGTTAGAELVDDAGSALPSLLGS